uniref:hypothetical protein n=1 Tax=Eubacterium cellulosolvens TaxID=29322 RepID=UPI00048A1F69|nr:hypothetical protein [[Eubacterium] cellulosolvens]
MVRKMGDQYRDQYFERYMDFLRKVTDDSRQKEGKAPYSDVTLKTMATDTFFLEKHEDRDFKEWLKSDDSLDEPRQALISHFTGRRKNSAKDAEYYVQRMIDFKRFLGM